MRQRTRPPLHPGSILQQHYLEPLGLTIVAVAKAVKVSRKTLSKIINGRGAITPEMALKLAQAFRTTPEFWMNLQRDYDLWQAQQHSDTWKQVPALVQASKYHVTGEEGASE
jgi:addiction module HigA family antidote